MFLPDRPPGRQTLRGCSKVRVRISHRVLPGLLAWSPLKLAFNEISVSQTMYLRRKWSLMNIQTSLLFHLVFFSSAPFNVDRLFVCIAFA